MSQNCKSPYTRAARDANNNTLYSGAPAAGGGGAACGGRGYTPPPVVTNNTYQQVTAKVLFGSVVAINDLKLQEKAAREARRTH